MKTEKLTSENNILDTLYNFISYQADQDDLLDLYSYLTNDTIKHGEVDWNCCDKSDCETKI